LGRYPFTDCINLYLPVEDGHTSAETLASTQRRLVQIGRIFHQLKAEGKVSTDNPRKIMPQDIDAFVGYRKKCKIKNTTILKDLGYLSKMLTYYDNEAVSKFKAKFPAHMPKKYQKCASSMEEPVVQRILDRAKEIPVSNWKMMEAYGLVSLAICTGFRPKELRMLFAKNVLLSKNFAEILAVYVKGEDSYGVERWVTVHLDGVEILRKYLDAGLGLRSLKKERMRYFLLF